MINRDDIEAGDKCHTRDGGCLVAYTVAQSPLYLGFTLADDWQENGLVYPDETHPLDIIRIEKAPKPVVEEVYLCSLSGGAWVTDRDAKMWQRAIKLTIINGKLDKAEQVK